MTRLCARAPLLLLVGEPLQGVLDFHVLQTLVLQDVQEQGLDALGDVTLDDDLVLLLCVLRDGRARGELRRKLLGQLLQVHVQHLEIGHGNDVLVLCARDSLDHDLRVLQLLLLALLLALLLQLHLLERLRDLRLLLLRERRQRRLLSVQLRIQLRRRRLERRLALLERLAELAVFYGQSTHATVNYGHRRYTDGKNKRRQAAGSEKLNLCLMCAPGVCLSSSTK